MTLPAEGDGVSCKTDVIDRGRLVPLEDEVLFSKYFRPSGFVSFSMLLMGDLSIAGSVADFMVLFQVLSGQTVRPLVRLNKVRIPIFGSFPHTVKEFLICKEVEVL